ncbi:MAG: GNAT family N-acetyltransferase [Desulfohalobiaceae bacterium]
MLRIHRIYDDVLPSNRSLLAQVQAIMRQRFPDVQEGEVEGLGEKLRNPFEQRFRSILFVAQSMRERVQGFALLLHEPLIGFVYLDWLATASGKTGGGLGGALYARVRMEAAALKAGGLFMECLPDSTRDCPETHVRHQNQARLRFYERYGARPIVGTDYEAPVRPGDTCMPHLVYDGLDRDRPLRKSFARKVVRAILERKYATLCPPAYVDRVVRSFRDDPVRLRPFKYVTPQATPQAINRKGGEQIALVVNERHVIHHVHERGYVQAPVRVQSILSELNKSGLFERIQPRHFSDRHILDVHDQDFVRFLRKACAEVPEGKSLYPYVFPIRNQTRPPRELSVLSGYYCIDTFTPLNRNAYLAARSGVDCALTAARQILGGRRLAYALVRPPGHHAEKRSFGGFCYFNNNAVAAHHLSSHGRVAILDIDYHHGNGQQDIFSTRNDVLTVSIHGDPRFAYPYFSGFADEVGEGEGEGFSTNYPLPQHIDGQAYRETLHKALQRITAFNPMFLVVALGLDPAKNDPTGTWSLLARDFKENGRLIGELGLPTLVVQEGGYRIRNLGRNAAHFFQGLAAGSEKWARQRHPQQPDTRLHGVTVRTRLDPKDVDRIRSLTEITGFFSSSEVEVAAELVQEWLAKGDASGYRFVMAEQFGRLVGYTCFGPIPCTLSSFDLYWIAVHPGMQRRGLGRHLMRHTEQRIRREGGTRIYLDTSQREQYAATRAFYERLGYRQESLLPDFYAPGDGKVIYCKALGERISE